MLPGVRGGGRGGSCEAAGIEAAIAEGLRRAREAGRKDPTLRDAVWELLLEAGDTLGRLPNRERGWLTGASRAHWPAFASVLTGETKLRPSPPSGSAIDRPDLGIPCVPQAAGAQPKRD